MTKDSAEIISILREAKFGWIADELTQSIAMGKQIRKEFQEEGSRRKSKGTSVIPYEPHEETELIVAALTRYFIRLPDAWGTASSTISNAENYSKLKTKNIFPVRTRRRHIDQTEDGEIDEAKPVTLGIENDEGDAFTTFNDNLFQDTEKLRSLLGQLWPTGPDEFEQRLQKGEF